MLKNYVILYHTVCTDVHLGGTWSMPDMDLWSFRALCATIILFLSVFGGGILFQEENEHEKD